MNFTDKQIEFIKNVSDHVEMLCGGRGYGKTHQLINEMQDKINNLQSKIDKAIEYINTIKDNTPNSTRKDFAKMILINYEFLLSILKEDK